jgi:hypothetical protein
MYDCFNVADCLPAPSSAQAQSTRQSHKSRGDRTPLPSSALSMSARSGVGDPAIVGVAWPVDPTDANLTVWRKDSSNPISVTGARGYAGPSTLFASQDGKTLNLLMADRGKTARYQTTDLATLHSWTVADSDFYNTSSGPSEFVALPDSGGLHALIGVAPPKPYRGGDPWYVIGTFDNRTLKFVPVAAPQPLDLNPLLIYSLVQQQIDGTTSVT